MVIYYNILQESEKAEESLEKSDRNEFFNRQFTAEGEILINYGIYHFENCNFEKAIELYLDALPMFKASGDKFNFGLVLSNLGEVQTITCEYEKAIESLQSAVHIFEELDNSLEKGEALFLLGKLYFELGDIENLSIVYKIYNEIHQLKLERLDFNYNYLGILFEL